MSPISKKGVGCKIRGMGEMTGRRRSRKGEKSRSSRRGRRKRRRRYSKY